jgi:THO complex subunit 2
MIFKQQKYNLLREESEGYSRLVAILSNVPSITDVNHASTAMHSITDVCAAVFSLIGRFDLDPNRALDIILGAFEQQPCNFLFFSLVKKFQKDSIVSILGFKFLQYQPGFWTDLACNAAPVIPVPAPVTISTSKLVGASKIKTPALTPASEQPITIPPGDEATTAALEGTPHSLYKITAVLIAMELVDLEDILPYLSPNLLEIHEQQEAADVLKRKEVQLIGVINLLAISKEKATAAPITLSKTTASGPMTSKPSSEKFPLGGGDKLDAEDSKPVPTTKLADCGNQVLGLIAGLICVRCWDLAQHLIALIRNSRPDSSTFDFDVMSIPEIRSATSALAMWLIEPNYHSLGYGSMQLANPRTENKSEVDYIIKTLPLFGSRQLLRADTDTAGLLFTLECKAILDCLGHRIGFFPLLFTKVCRVARRQVELIVKDNDANALLIHFNEHYVSTLLSECLLPGLTLASCNPALSYALWDAIGLLPFDLRFQLYAKWRGDKMGKLSLGVKSNDLAEAEELTLLAAKGCLKRLTKENVKTVGRLIGKHTHSYPLIVFNHILSQIEAYENLIPYVVDALKVCTPQIHCVNLDD